MDDLGSMFSLNNLPGHLSYVLIAVSYWLTEIFWLRVVAIVGLAFEILYFSYSGGDLRTGIGWDLIFIAINAYQLFRLVQERLSFHLPEADRELLRAVLVGLKDVQIVRLLSVGEFGDIPPGTKLTEEDQPLERLFFICAGHVRVMVGGREVSRLETGSLVGEIAFLTEKPATATVVADDDVRALVFDKDKLRQLFKNETEVAGLIYQLMGRELAHKVKVSNTRIAATT
jgi:CRP-like cAMP-binding protein